MHGHIAGVHGGLHGVFGAGDFISAKTLGPPKRVGSEYIQRSIPTPATMAARSTPSSAAFVDWALASPEAATQRVLIDPSAVDESSSSSWLWWLFGGGVALAAVGGGAYFFTKKKRKSGSKS